MVDQSPILVIGATGRHGGTGNFVAHDLKRRGAVVRALVRQHDSRSEALQASGIEVVIGDLHDERSLKGAVEGVKTAYFTYPIAKGVVDAAANFAAAARDSGVERVVVMSMGITRQDSPSPLGRAQWLAEEVLQWSGLATTNLRVAALFVENIDLLHRDDILEEGILRNSFADVPLSWITGEDAGKLAVAALLHPERLKGERTIYPSGGAQVSHAEVAQALSERLGRPIRHETVPRKTWAERLVSLSLADGRLSPEMAEHISTVGIALRQKLPMNELFEELTHEKPTSILEAIQSGRVGGGPGAR
jgi:uncharacterized protein YbjT (DUF2867 family)